MIGYITIGTNDLTQAENFYDNLMSVIGIKQLFKTETQIAWGKDFNSPMLCVTLPYNKEAATSGNGTMIALRVDNNELVEKMFHKAISLGAQDEGAPGLRGKTFFGAYIRDLDGNKLNFHHNNYEVN